MYDFITKKQISRRIADKQHIPVYRRLLAACRVPSSGMLMADADELARSLVFMLLDKYTEAQITAACSPMPEAIPATAAQEAAPARQTPAVKKKSRSSRNTRS